MNDVARAAGVSMMTVSNVLNDRPRVGEETRRRVLDVVADLGYEVNLTARHLRSGRTDTVAFVVPGFQTYFDEIADRLAAAFGEQGRHLVVESTGARPENELAALSSVRLSMYDGVILSVVGLTRAEIEGVRTTAPLVLLGEVEVPDRFDHVMLANAEGAELATARMLATGSRRIAVVGGDSEGSQDGGMAATRRAGWVRAHERAGLVADPALVAPAVGVGPEVGREAVRHLERSGVDYDGVFALTDSTAVGVLAGLAEAGRRVPQDVQVVGFDNLDLAEFTVPGLTSVDPGRDAVAQHAARLLQRRIDGATPEPEHVVVPVRLVERGSTRASQGHPPAHREPPRTS